MAASLWLVVAVAAVARAANVVTRPDEPPTTSKPTKILDSTLSADRVPAQETTAQYWRRSAKNAVREKVATKINLNKAKNGILFIGDGMSLATVMAARTFAGQLNSRTGEETRLAFEEFPVSGLVKTYCLDAQVADSACTATSYLTGVKTKYGTIGLDGNVTRGRCQTQLSRPNWTHSILAWALEHGLDTGIVTTTRVTHASPAGAYAHAADRDWECDADLPPDVAALGCSDIASQLVREMPGKNFKVIMGGGRREFLPNLTSSGEPDAGRRVDDDDLTSSGQPDAGRRLDGVDLTAEWGEDKHNRNLTHRYVTDRDGLIELSNMPSEDMPEYFLGLFHDDHMEYHLRSQSSQPTLQEMTELAIKLLSRNPKGYFLFVEGGRIDHAHHENMAHLALDETLEYSKAVSRAVSMTNEDETLVVVSSDHAHTMTVAGYPSRGNDILGVVDSALGDDGIPYTTLSYANGIGYAVNPDGSRFDVTTDKNFTARDVSYRYPGAIPVDSETHGGEDVAVWARGPWQHAFSSTYEQHVLPHLMAYAMCIADDRHAACGGRGSAGSGASAAPTALAVAAGVLAWIAI